MGNPYPVKVSDENFEVRLDGRLTFTDAANQPGVTPGTVVPVADPSGVTVDTTTYPNEITGTGTMVTLVFPRDTAALAMALEGDAFPRWLLELDPSNLGLALGDGVLDIGAYAATNVAIENVSPGILALTINGSAAGARFVVGTNDAHIGVLQWSFAPLRIQGGGSAGSSATIHAGAGAPSGGGNVGDLYIRSDGDPTANTYLYRCSVAGTAGNATWVGLVTS